MAVTVAEINAKIDLYVTAIGASDYTAALARLREASGMIAVLADSEKDSQKLTFDRKAISNLIKDLEGKSSATTGIQRQKVVYKN